jgi:hypothetical protein
MVSIFLGYGSPYAREAIIGIPSTHFGATFGAGSTKIAALPGLQAPRSSGKLGGFGIRFFTVGQDRPDAYHLYGVVLAIPDQPSRLTNSLLYQAVGLLVEDDATAGATGYGLPNECEDHTARFPERLWGA